MARTTQLTSEYLEAVERLGGDAPGRASAWCYMRQSTAKSHHEIVATSFVPRLFDDASWHTLASAAERMHAILCKVIAHYRTCPEYRALFSLDARMERLICLPAQYDQLLPFARLDAFFDEDAQTVRFCEFNADGSSGMNEDREAVASLQGASSFQEFALQHTVESCELVHSWVSQFLALCHEALSKRADASLVPLAETPHIAIVDYLDVATTEEFEVYAQAFEDAGLSCSICDIRTLRFEDGRLLTREGQPIDAVWRRAVGNDVLARWDEARTFLQALEAHAFVLIGGFAGHVAHDKQIFRVLRLPETLQLLTAEEQEFVLASIPETEFLTDETARENNIRANKDAWVLKPTDSYGANEVYVGAACTQREWERALDACLDPANTQAYLLQKFVAPYRTLTIPLTAPEADAPNEVTPVEYKNLSGLYMYNGQFIGVFSRIGPHEIVCGTHEGLTAPTLRVRD